jgi:hypothetical protein
MWGMMPIWRSSRPVLRMSAISPDRAAIGNLNHVGTVVDDLDAVEAKVKAHGYDHPQP